MLIIEYLIMLILIAVLVFCVVQFYNIIFRGYAPFIPSRGEAMRKVVETLDMRPDGTVYELGCGSAGFLRLMRQKYKDAKLIGIEYSILPYTIAQIQNSLSASRIQFRKKNFFQVDLRDADVIYCFLNMDTMAKLEPKLKAECRPGTQLVSYHFTLPNHTPEKVMEFKYKDKMYLYKL
jgi:trans-aconitate methyltransferase